ncbi:MAG: ribokinase [Clostridia bacterium]|nr:ribokinase [Clostridia bacterium]
MKITVIGLGGDSLFMNVDHFHREGETLAATSFFSEPGGKGYNQAVAAARLGGDVSFLGAFGKDSGSDKCVNFLKKEGIKPLVIYKDIPCACACILTDKTGENRVTVFGGAAALLNAEDIEVFKAEIGASQILILQNEVLAEANRRALEIAKAAGVTVVFNPAPAVGVDRELLLSADVITPNKHEAQLLFGDDYKSGIENSGIKTAVVTLGGDGAELYEKGRWTHIPPYKVSPVDTTGGGDCFNGAFAVGICMGKTLEMSCDFACRAASVAVSRPHAVEAMPHFVDISSKKQ